MPNRTPHPGALSRRSFLGALAAATAAALSSCGSVTPATHLNLDRRQLTYGPDPLQVGDLTVPSGPGPHPVAVLIHGGYWSTGLDRSTMAPLGDALGRRGFAVWNVDYRTVGVPGGGWPGTFQDIGSCLDHLGGLRAEQNLDLARVVTMGHSAGGHLALWSAARGRLAAPLDDPPVVPVTAAVSFAGIPDLAAAASAAGGGYVATLRQAVTDLLGGPPTAVPERYAAASPRALVPLGAPQLLVHGDRDGRVPIGQAHDYLQAATAAGDAVHLVEVPTGDHANITRVDRNAWPQVTAWLTQVVSGPR